MSDESRKVVPDKESLNRERPVTKALKFPSCTRQRFFSHLNWNGVCEKECIQRDTMTGMVVGYHKKERKEEGRKERKKKRKEENEETKERTN